MNDVQSAFALLVTAELAAVYVAVVLLVYGIVTLVRKYIPPMKTGWKTLTLTAVLSLAWGVLAAYVITPDSVGMLWLGHALFFAGFLFIGPLAISILAPKLVDVFGSFQKEEERKDIVYRGRVASIATKPRKNVDKEHWGPW